MGRVISFEERAVATLRARLGEAEGARDDLIAFAHGHTGAVAAIHQAVLAAIEARDVQSLIDVVTRTWPALLATDSAALALVIGERAFTATALGTSIVEPRLVDDARRRHAPLSMRSVGRGHPLFGAVAAGLRAEALIAIDCGPGLPRGLLLLGQRQSLDLESLHGSHLLQFLGHSLAAIIARWLTAPTD